MIYNFINIYLSFLLLFYYFFELGSFFSKKLFKQKTSTSVSILIGFGFLISAINIIYTLGIRNFKLILVLFLMNILYFIIKNIKNFNLKLDSNTLFLSFFIFLTAILSFYNEYLTFDDFHGYAKVYSSIINNNFNFDIDQNLRNFFSGFGYNFIQSIFIYIGGFNSIYFFDQMFGTSLILIFFYEQLKNKNFFPLIIFLVLLSTFSIKDTSQPYTIIFAMTLVLLPLLKNFYDYPHNILIIFSLIIISFNLKYSTPLFFTTLFFSIIAIHKLFKKQIDLKENYKIILILISVFLLPDLINKYFIFENISPALFGSKFSIFENIYFDKIDFINQQNYYKNNFYLLIFFKKHFIIILLLTATLYFIKRDYFYIITFLFYICSIVVWSIIQFPDLYNIRRYLLPLENAFILFMMLEFFQYYKGKNFFKILILFFVIISLNLNFSSFRPTKTIKFYKIKIANTINIFNEKYAHKAYFLYNNFSIPSDLEKMKYIKEFEKCLYKIEPDKNILSLINFEFLINRKNVTFIDKGFGFNLSEKQYPLLQNFDIKYSFFKKNYPVIIFEKNVLLKDYVYKRFLKDLNWRLKDDEYDISNFFNNYSLYDKIPLISYYDFLKFIDILALRSKNKQNLCETDRFLLIELK